MTGQLPIRARLTLWYSTVLALCLVAFAVMLWFSLRESLTSSKHAELEERIRSLQMVLAEQSGESGVSNETLREELNEFSSALPSDFSIHLSDSSGSSLFRTKAAQKGRAVERDEVIQAGGHKYHIKMAVSLEAVDEILLRLGRILLFSIPFAVLAASLGGYWL
ncbi:MAG: hypothetical protein ABL967_19435, partial [Bryobacteraceae bacterium]